MAKAFDTISHKILLHKLSFYGFSTLSCSFFKSYLTRRYQKVKGNTSFSDELPITIGVPQGSILGPILFLICINDLPNVFINCKCHLYADDTTIYCRANTKVEAEKCLQLNLNKVSNWLHDNQLVVNVSKSNIMLVGTKTSVGNSSITASINGANLAYVSNIRLLGTYLDTLQKIQNRCARICTNNFDYKTPSSLLLRQLKGMDIVTRHTFFTGILMYKFVNGLLPPNLMNEFRFGSDIHTYPTRSSCNSNIVLLLVKTEFFKRTLSYTGPVLWNSLPPDLRKSASANI